MDNERSNKDEDKGWPLQFVLRRGEGQSHWKGRIRKEIHARRMREGEREILGSKKGRGAKSLNLPSNPNP